MKKWETCKAVVSLWKRLYLGIFFAPFCRVYFGSKEKKLNGWIWDGIWWSAQIIYLISAHNTVLAWNRKTDTIEVASSCKEQCILYLLKKLIFNSFLEIIVGSLKIFLTWSDYYLEFGIWLSQFWIKDVFSFSMRESIVLFT